MDGRSRLLFRVVKQRAANALIAMRRINVNFRDVICASRRLWLNSNAGLKAGQQHDNSDRAERLKREVDEPWRHPHVIAVSRRYENANDVPFQLSHDSVPPTLRTVGQADHAGPEGNCLLTAARYPDGLIPWIPAE